MASAARAAVRSPVVLAGAALAAVALASWAILATADESMPMAIGPFLFAWLVMMAAMMLPSAAPLVLLYAKQRRPEPLVAGYMVVWAAVGVAVYGLSIGIDLMAVPPAAVAAVLVAAGIYQLTPLKTACLRRCRSPASFLIERWGRGAFRLGVEHGAYCVGCCWGLMAVLVVAGAMGVAWAAAIALVVFSEKVLRGGLWIARVGAVALVALGVAVAVDPDLAARLTESGM